ncbi:hypothetical protein D9615_002069 [Tricholomella constricta]|uniref:CCHC-type domain-containing protein n=1 Tax=Tricholomella constricta TaxID=117010 RepID=A0A8H5HP92_9AGAR|nr:hypothetical protein D9615_002069 [Tricholomella constricta]
MAATHKGSWKSKKPRGACWNCGKTGHFKDKCLEPPKAEKSEKKASGAANAAVSDSEDEAFFAADLEDTNLDISLPPLKAVSDSSSSCGDVSKGGEGDWFSEVGSVCDDLLDSAWDFDEAHGLR